MCFIMNQNGILADKSGVKGSRLESTAIAGEQQPAADHVDRANDDGGPRGVISPLCVVSELAAQCAHAEQIVHAAAAKLFQLQPDGIEIEARIVLQPFLQLFSLSCRLIDDYAPVHYPNQP